MDRRTFTASALGMFAIPIVNLTRVIMRRRKQKPEPLLSRGEGVITAELLQEKLDEINQRLEELET